jgi:bifunctional DNA-binding transcriptional regulator/antitoxin component of YhaV-PrlF toxin-antitoxin module
MPVVVKVTSKGQFTLPMQYRKSLGINKDSYILIDEVGNFLVLEKLQKLDQITKILSSKAKEKKITKEEVIKTLKKIQAEKYKQKKKDMFGVDPWLKKKGTKNLRDEIRS